eukprot:CAMPEP_0115202066 /NCGR_PEP_ID=MMETSP0270-20121206/17943_1 /TAXON_ID=71861 /ORGANISM="Scrippsiella trochoidea, Strain CCMP3099" /LENGTH=180 /DNA_ID=CAMNT_0002615485 /DNA_START=666 /DNA_END=1208 /DNA_ORIENTATION=+
MGIVVGLSDPVPPIPTADRDEVHLGSDDATTNGGCDFLCTLCPKPDVAILIAHQHIANESIGLPSGGHLLHWVDFHHLVFEGAWLEELINDLVLFDGQAMQVDVLNGIDLPILDQAPKLGDRDPSFSSPLPLPFPFLPLPLPFPLPLPLSPKPPPLPKPPSPIAKGENETRSAAAEHACA